MRITEDERRDQARDSRHAKRGSRKRLHRLGYRVTSWRRALLLFAFDLAGFALVWPFFLWRRARGLRFRPEEVRSIAVFRLDGIGDLVLSTIALAALQDLLPAARVTLFVNRWAVDLAGLLPGVAEVVELQAPQFDAFKTGRGWMGSLVQELRLLRRLGCGRRFDLGVDLRGDALSVLPLAVLGPRFLCSRTSRAGGFLVTNPVTQVAEGEIAEAELHVGLVEKVAGRAWTRRQVTLAVPPARARANVAARLPVGVLDAPYVCLAVAAPYAARCYAPEYSGPQF